MKGPDQADSQSPTVKIESAGVRTRKCMVHLLNGQEFQCNVQKNANGSQLLRQIRELLDIIEFDYFGLYFEDSTQMKYWLEPDKSIKKQLKNSPWKFHMSVKFFPSDPSQLAEDMARYYMVLQLRHNIVSGRLPCSFVTHALLGSFVVQSELGDFDPLSMRGNYVKGFEFAPNQTSELEDKVIELHKTHKGLTPEQAEIAFLENAKKLPLYGVDQHIVKDSENVELILGVSWNGLKVYRDQTPINRFAWPRIVKMSYTRNKYFIKIRPVEEQIDESIVGFKLHNHKSAKRLWKSSVEHHTFFRMTKPELAKPKLVRTGSKFRYSGQTQHQTRQVVANSTRKNVPKIQRTPSRRSQRGPSASLQTPPELPRKERSNTTATTTQVITTIVEEEVTEVKKDVPDVVEIITSTETTEIQTSENIPQDHESSSSSSSSSDEEGMDALSKHQKRVLKMKPQNANDEKSSEDGKFLEESVSDSKGSEWDAKLQSSPAKTTEQQESDSISSSEHEDVTVATEADVTEILRDVVDQEKSLNEDATPSPVDESSDSHSPTDDAEKQQLASSEEDLSNDSPCEVETEPVTHTEEYHEVVMQNPHAADTDEETQPEVEKEKTPLEDTATTTSSSDSSSSESSTDDDENKEYVPHAEYDPGNENNNNNDDGARGDVVASNVIMTVETKSVRVEDVVIPREDNEVRKVALTADGDNNITVSESKSSSSSSSSSSSDSDSTESDVEDPPVDYGFKKPPIVETKVAYIEPTAEETPAVTLQPPVVQTETKTITYESNQPAESELVPQDVQLLSSQTITAETMSSVTTTHITKTVVGSVSETRVEKSIVITADGESDLHQAMAEAIKDTQVSNPEVSITKVVVHEEKVVENPK